MWAQTLTGPGTFELGVVAAPDEGSLRPGDVLLRVLAGGICGSDLPFFRGGLSPVSIPGENGGLPTSPAGAPLHEIVGEVMATRDPSLVVGDRVVGWASGTNGLCEYVMAEADGLATFDPGLPPATAIMLQPLACVLGVTERLSPVAGKRVAVIGQGPIGVLFSYVLDRMGAGGVTGVDLVDRSDIAAAFGVDRGVRAASDSWAASLAEADRPQLVIEAIGHQVGTVADAVRAVARNGEIVCFGIPDDLFYPFPMMEFVRKNATMLAGVTWEKRAALAQASRYLAAHPDLAGGYVTHRFAFRDAQAAFDLAARPSKGRLKVVLDVELDQPPDHFDRSG
jgi:L-iditol 2-dehydrogenase